MLLYLENLGVINLHIKTIRLFSLSISLFTALTLVLFPTVSQASHYSRVPLFSVYVDGKAIPFDAEPFLEENRLMVPLRPLAIALGSQIEYDQPTQTATVNKGDIQLVLNFKQQTVEKNGNLLQVTPKPRIVADRTMVPLRFISETFGLPVSWDPATNVVRVGPTEETQAKWDQIRDTMVKSRNAMNTLKSFKADAHYQIHLQLPYSLSLVDVTGEASAVYHVDPLTVHIQTSPGSMDNLSPEFKDQFAKLWDLYIGNGKVSYKDGLRGDAWVTEKLSSGETKDLTQPFASYLTDDVIENILPYASLSSDNGAPTLTLQYTGDDIRGIQQARDARYGYRSFTDNDEFYPSSITVILTLNKDSFFLQKAYIEARMLKRIPYTAESTIELSEFNTAPEITLPEHLNNPSVIE